MLLHLMLKIFVSDAWLASCIFIENFWSKLFGTILQDLYNYYKPHTFLSHSTVQNEFFIPAAEFWCISGMFIKSCRYWLLI